MPFHVNLRIGLISTPKSCRNAARRCAARFGEHWYRMHLSEMGFPGPPLAHGDSLHTARRRPVAFRAQIAHIPRDAALSASCF